MPFCGLAAIETLAGVRTAVEDPLLEFIGLQQPGAAFAAFLEQQVEALATRLA